MRELLWAGTEMSALKKTALVAELASMESMGAGCARRVEGYIPLCPG